MNYRVEITENAIDDLKERLGWIEEKAGGAVAEAYDARIRARIYSLAHFPNRGSPRDSLKPGIRSLSFERRLIIYYDIEADVVRVLRVVHAAQDQSDLFNL